MGRIIEKQIILGKTQNTEEVSLVSLSSNMWAKYGMWYQALYGNVLIKSHFCLQLMQWEAPSKMTSAGALRFYEVFLFKVERTPNLPASC